MVIAAALAFAALADAPVDAPTDAPSADVSDAAAIDAAWADVDHRATNTARLGIAVSAVGPPVGLVGFIVVLSQALGNEGAKPWATGILAGGLLATVGGPPLLASGSLRSRTALGQRGAQPTGDAGAAAWGLWGGSIALTGAALIASNNGDGQLAGILGLGGLGSYAGSIVAGVVQLHRDGIARGTLPSVSVAPWIDRDRGGVVVSVVF